MRRLRLSILTCLLVLGCSWQVANAQTSAKITPTPVPFPEWQPPTARPKAKTTFAPKPSEGNNIFKGEAEVWLADASAKMGGVYFDPINDKEVSDYITKLGKYLGTYSAAPQRSYTFVVLDSNDEDAFSIGDGRIYITVGMLKNMTSEDELAAVLAPRSGTTPLSIPRKR